MVGMVHVTVLPLLVIAGVGAPGELLARRALPLPWPGAAAKKPPLW